MNFNILLLYLVLAMQTVLVGNAQNIPAKNFDFTFTRFLIDNAKYSEADFLIEQHLEANSSLSFADTAHYLKGMIGYRQMDLRASLESLQKISTNSKYHTFSQFLAGYELAYLKENDQSLSLFRSIQTQDSTLLELKKFQEASLSLLNNDLLSYEADFIELGIQSYQLEDHAIELSSLYERSRNFNPKSPLLAGALSAVVPGAGKMYAGKFGEGITSLFSLGILGVMTYENYKKEGIKNYKTIIFGSLFSLFYAANIHGSVISVKVYQDEFYQSLHHAVLFNMHIPIRSIFKSHFK